VAVTYVLQTHTHTCIATNLTHKNWDLRVLMMLNVRKAIHLPCDTLQLARYGGCV